MRLKVMIPTDVLVDEEADKVVAEAPNGQFCLLPNHIDFVSSLSPGLLTFEQNGQEGVVALDRGLLVKNGSDVLVSANNGVRGRDLASMKEAIEQEFLRVDERERKTQSVVARLEADFINKYIGTREPAHA